MNYFDNFYNAELYLRHTDIFSSKYLIIKILSINNFKNAVNINIEDIHQLYLTEFLNAFHTTMNKMSTNDIHISHVTSKSVIHAKYMSDIPDNDWGERRGKLIESVGLASITCIEESKKLINTEKSRCYFF